MLFASYSNIDRDRIGVVLGDLRALGHDVWLDEQLSGGQLWWDEILEHIRACDAFLFLLTPAAVASEACLTELGYAQSLRRTIIPIELEAMNPALLPSVLSQHQLVSYSDGSRAELMTLSRALGRLAVRSLPDPLPDPPPLPGGYFSTLRDQIATSDALTLEQQLGVLHRLQARADDGSSDEILALLAMFRRRDDVYASVAEEADRLRAEVTAAAAAALPATPAAGPAGRRRRWRPDDLLGWLIVVLAGAAVLAGLLALFDPFYEAAPDTVVNWEDDRWGLIVLVVLFAAFTVITRVTVGRACRVVTVLALAVAVFVLITWWEELRDVLGETDIASNSGPITLGPGMNWMAVSAELQLLAALLLVVDAFSTPRRVTG